tara:strand:+ start:6300 stop:7247 length:948 start_codon:yes stop_codon:yes gene_type:complete
MNKKPTISFIIPAYNEENYLHDTLSKLHQFAPNCPYEVIIVDNGSTDKTRNIALSLSDKVLDFPDGHISAVRNHGVKHSAGEILVFLDADVKLTKAWQEHIIQTVNNLKESPLLITGSRCLPPQNSNSLNLHWFNLLVDNNSTTYINSGHLITSRLLFDKINGFNEGLRTAEDHDFCVRASKNAATIKPVPALEVIHEGYPTTYRQFIKRERWQGREDFKTLNSLLKSKIGLIACLHLLITLFTVSFLVQGDIINGVTSYLVTMSILMFALTCYKFQKTQTKSLVFSSFIHYLYIIGRTMALIDRITFRYTNKFR